METIGYKVAVIESEKDWGSKIDDYMVCLNKTDLSNFIIEFNSANNKKTTPDWYMYAESSDTISTIELNENQKTLIETSTNQRCWLSEIKNIK